MTDGDRPPLLVAASDSATTAAIDTTGATLIVAAAANYAAAPVVPTDSQGNTWTALATRVGGGARVRLYYCLSPSVSASHTFGHANLYLAVAAYSGVGSFDQESGAGGDTPGAITPGADGALLFLSQSFGLGTHAASGGFSVVQALTNRGAIAELIQPSAAVADPAWSGVDGDRSASMAAFLPSGGGGGGPGIPAIVHHMRMQGMA